MQWLRKKKSVATITRRDLCEVCGYLTLDADRRNLCDICPVCFWEDDEFHKDPNEPCFGANYETTLNQARQNFSAFGASRKEDIGHVRQPLPEEIPSQAS